MENNTLEHTWWTFPLAVVIALVVATAVTVGLSLLLAAIGRRRPWASVLRSHARIPFRVLVFVVVLWVAFALTFPLGEWMPWISHAFRLATIGATTWLVAAALSFALGATMSRYRVDVSDNRVARRVRTQLAIVRRLAVVVIAVIGLASALLTFPGVQAVGASLLASAGVLSVIAGIAAQSALGNVFAGVQLAFSEALRVDDVVIADGEWGRVEEVTLTYVVVHIWDDRRLVLPSTYFTTTPFQNWTRRTSDLIGSVLLDADWGVDIAAMREELDAILADTELWDGRTAVVQITEATGGFVQVRVLVSAQNAGALWDLRCFVRERLVAWVFAQKSQPRTRVRVLENGEERVVEDRRMLRENHHQAGDPSVAGVFSGSDAAERRAEQFTSAIPIVEHPTPAHDDLAGDAAGDDRPPSGSHGVQRSARG